MRQDGAGGADEALEVCDPQGRPALHHLLRDIGAVAVRPGPAGAHDGEHAAGLELGLEDRQAARLVDEPRGASSGSCRLALPNSTTCR